ncbi:GOLPH3/VPS74 family protein [Kitasatospora camelliae]|uniref:GPP34 family phosphoprotein n=1 Tax=Kitasatospora camelliae TaxID=3156397 RepID=A0AAU8K323_9ACTN
MSVTLSEEIMLLSLDDVSGTAKDRLTVGWPVVGGILLDLALRGRITVTNGVLAIADLTPTGEALLDGRLEMLAAWIPSKRKPKVGDWMMKDQQKAVAAAVESLCRRGLVAEERHKLLGLFPVKRYPEVDGSVERELRARLKAVVQAGAHPDERTAGLIALLHGSGLHRLAFPGVPGREVKPRMAEIAAGQWADGALREAIQAAQAAILAATTAAVVAASVS